MTTAAAMSTAKTTKAKASKGPKVTSILVADALHELTAPYTERVPSIHSKRLNTAARENGRDEQVSYDSSFYHWYARAGPIWGARTGFAIP
jgi:hypothetical protein